MTETTETMINDSIIKHSDLIGSFTILVDTLNRVGTDINLASRWLTTNKDGLLQKRRTKKLRATKLELMEQFGHLQTDVLILHAILNRFVESLRVASIFNQ